MATTQGYLTNLSQSSLSALRWAQAAAAHRMASASGAAVPSDSGHPPSPAPPSGTQDVFVEPDDLLVGILLAHPDERGEARVLLEHFGLTALDVLPESYPNLPVADLRQRAGGVNPDTDPQLGPETMLVLDAARQLGSGQADLRHLLGALLQQSYPFRWSLAFASRGTDWTQVMGSYQRWLAGALPGPIAGSTSSSDDGGDGPAAGNGLAGWLTRENPRRPLDLPVYAPDRIDAERDLIGIQAEADAFAYLIASCDLKPPLAVGLFGDWGSGKSFLMRAINQRLRSIKRLVADQDQCSVRVWKNIVPIEFNAWEYVQGNLWAGLLERIFGELGTLQPRLVESWREPTKNQLAEVEKSAKDLGERVEEANKQIKNRQERADEAQKATDKARADAANRANQERDRVAQERARQALRALWGWLPVLLLGKRGDDLVEALGQARAELARGNALLGAYWRRPLHVLLVSVAALLIPTVLLLLVWAKAPPVVSVLGGLVAVVPVLTSTLAIATRWGRRQLTDLEKAEEEVRAEIYKPVRDAETKLHDARAALEEAQQQLTATKLERRNAEERTQQLREELQELTPGRILVAFADQRSTEYGRRLGLLAQVRRDLGELENEIIANNEALRASLPQGAPAATIPAGHTNPMYNVPNRIVLYIDDLDRCPPGKVLEVLEAVHLLLSFEMFVVVVAVDSRWLTSALTDRLVALRPSPTATGQPTPNDYLEKIFQLPFWVQPLPPSGRGQLLRGLLRGSVREHAEAGRTDGETATASGLQVGDPEEELIDAMLLRHGTEVRLDTSPLVITPADLAFFESLAPLLGDTPRRIKRFVNTCQLLFAIAPPLPSGGPFPSERAVVSLVAAISEGLPTVASHLLPELEASSQGNPPHAPTRPAPSQLTLTDFLASCSGVADDERERLNTWLVEHPDWQPVQLQRLDIRLDMIRRLRFDKPASLRRSGPSQSTQPPPTLPLPSLQR